MKGMNLKLESLEATSRFIRGVSASFVIVFRCKSCYKESRMNLLPSMYAFSNMENFGHCLVWCKGCNPKFLDFWQSEVRKA